jgi:hypothetical protein
MLEMSEDGYNRIGVERNDISKGLLQAKPECNDEEPMREALLNRGQAQPLGDHPVVRDRA